MLPNGNTPVKDITLGKRIFLSTLLPVGNIAKNHYLAIIDKN